MSDDKTNLPVQAGAPQDGAMIQSQSGEVTRFPVVDLDSATELPDLTNATPLPLELTSTYWEAKVGEAKRVIFSHIEAALMPDRANPQVQKEVDCAFFYETVTDKDGVKSIVLIRQASKLLVSALQDNKVARGTPLLIANTGEKEFKNGNKGDTWSVKPLMIKISEPGNQPETKK